ncbi:unnamed protein product [Hydatigera taeniaeformis]|uniref:Uncharacterized protein n=1 Tax=Hydatigena taeniaeformis TaxID=6205 RepID=A0A0R3WYD4_HYDTA|nr:unnamed protein product [Hydatigera taeniaeformis]
MTTEGEATNPPATGGANAPETEGAKETESPATAAPPVKQTKCILLTGFGGPKYLRVQSKDQRTVGKGEIAVEVEACSAPLLMLPSMGTHGRRRKDGIQSEFSIPRVLSSYLLILMPGMPFLS